jgi:hypothetical protein
MMLVSSVRASAEHASNLSGVEAHDFGEFVSRNGGRGHDLYYDVST